MARMTSGASATNSAAYLRMSAASPRGPAIVDPHVAADGPAQLLPAPAGTPRGGPAHPDRPRLQAEHADAPHPLALLRARRERPRDAAPPRSVMNSRRFMPEASRASDQKDSTPQYGRRLLR